MVTKNKSTDNYPKNSLWNLQSQCCQVVTADHQQTQVNFMTDINTAMTIPQWSSACYFEPVVTVRLNYLQLHRRAGRCYGAQDPDVIFAGIDSTLKFQQVMCLVIIGIL